MPSTTQCNVIKNNQNLCNEEKTAWMLNAQNAIGNLIGRPSNRALRLATTEKNKRIEGARHVAHKKLYAKLVNYTMEAAGEAPANKGKKKPTKARLDKSDEEAINAAKASAFIKEDEEA